MSLFYPLGLEELGLDSMAALLLWHISLYDGTMGMTCGVVFGACRFLSMTWGLFSRDACDQGPLMAVSLTTMMMMMMIILYYIILSILATS